MRPALPGVNNLWNKDVCSCNYYGLVRVIFAQRRYRVTLYKRE